MKTFAGVKTLAAIKAQCAAAGVAFDDYGYRNHGHDYVCLGHAQPVPRPDGTPFVSSVWKGYGYVMFNTFNGNFHGCTDTGAPFDSKSTKDEKEPWFQALLSFFYEEK